MPQGHALSEATTVEVVTAYGTAPADVPSTEDTPRVLGEFFLPKACDARLDVEGLVTADDTTLTVSLYDLATGPVSGSSCSTSARTPTRFLSGLVSLAAGHRYQIHAVCAADSPGDDAFGHVLTATISN